jgi:hypothetical protein
MTNQLVYRVKNLQVKVEHLAPGSRSLQLPVPYLSGVVESHYLIPTKLNQYFNPSLLLKAAN